jgi:hypothetical protein
MSTPPPCAASSPQYARAAWAAPPRSWGGPSQRSASSFADWKTSSIAPSCAASRAAHAAKRESPRRRAVLWLRRGLQWSRRPRVILGAGALAGASGVAARCDVSAGNPGVCGNLASLGARHDCARHRRDDHGRGRDAAGRDVKRRPNDADEERLEPVRTVRLRGALLNAKLPSH